MTQFFPAAEVKEREILNEGFLIAADDHQVAPDDHKDENNLIGNNDDDKKISKDNDGQPLSDQGIQGDNNNS